MFIPVPTSIQTWYPWLTQLCGILRPVADTFVSSKVESVSILLDCLWVFMYAVESNSTIALMFLNENRILERIYQKLYHKDLQVKLATLKVFSAISGAVNSEDEQTFLTIEFMAALQSLISSSCSAELRLHAAFCFSNLVCSNCRDIEKVLDHPLFPTFLGQMRVESKLSIIKELAIGAANIVTFCSYSQLMKLARFDFLGSVISLSEQAEKNKNILELCLRIMAEMVQKGEDLRGDYAGINPILSEISAQETLYHRLTNQLESIASISDVVRDRIHYIDDLLLTHTNIYN